MVLLIAGLTGLLCFLLVLLLLVYGQHLRRQNILYRMRYYQVTETAGPVQAKALLKKGQSLLTRLARPISRRESVQALDLKMRQAGLPLLGGEFFVLLWGIALLMGVAAWMLTLTWQLALLAAAAQLGVVVGGQACEAHRAQAERFLLCLRGGGCCGCGGGANGGWGGTSGGSLSAAVAVVLVVDHRVRCVFGFHRVCRLGFRS